MCFICEQNTRTFTSLGNRRCAVIYMFVQSFDDTRTSAYIVRKSLSFRVVCCVLQCVLMYAKVLQPERQFILVITSIPNMNYLSFWLAEYKSSRLFVLLCAYVNVGHLLVSVRSMQLQLLFSILCDH